MKYLPSYYRELERELRELAQEVDSMLTDSDRRWITEFLDSGEYGIVMSRILEALERSELEAPTQTLQRVHRLAVQMDLQDEFEEHLPSSNLTDE